MAKPRVHIAGPIVDGIQKCLRCGFEFKVKHDLKALVITDPSPSVVIPIFCEPKEKSDVVITDIESAVRVLDAVVIKLHNDEKDKLILKNEYRTIMLNVIGTQVSMWKSMDAHYQNMDGAELQEHKSQKTTIMQMSNQMKSLLTKDEVWKLVMVG